MERQQFISLCILASVKQPKQSLFFGPLQALAWWAVCDGSEVGLTALPWEHLH